MFIAANNDDDEDYREEPLMKRVAVDRGHFNGQPYLKEAGIAVRRVLYDLGAGRTPERLLEQYQTLKTEDIQAALLYAAWKIGTYRENETLR